MRFKIVRLVGERLAEPKVDSAFVAGSIRRNVIGSSDQMTEFNSLVVPSITGIGLQ